MFLPKNKILFFLVSSLLGNAHLFGAAETPVLDTIADLRTLEEKEITDQDAEQLVRQFQNMKTPRERKITAMTLGRHYLRKENLPLAKNYFTVAMQLAEKDEILRPIIHLHLAEVAFALKNYAEVNVLLLPEVRLFSKNRKYYWQKQISELLIQNLSKQNNHAAIKNLYPRFKKLGLAKVFSKDVLLILADSLHQSNNLKDEQKVLEHLAKDYPLTPASKTAFASLKKYNQETTKSGLPKYVFSERLLKAISANHTVSDNVEELVAAELKNLIVDNKDKLVKLDPIKRFDLLLKFNLLEAAKKQYPAANAHYALNPEQFKKEWFLVLGRYHSLLNEPAIASSYFNQYLALVKGVNTRDTERVFEQTAYEQQRLGDFMKAAEIFKTLSEKRRSVAYEWDYFWNTYLSGDYKNALTILDTRKNKLTSKDSFEPLASLYWRAKIHRKMNEEEIAQRYEKELLATDKSSYYSQLILAARPSFDSAAIPGNEMKSSDLSNANLDYRLAAKSFFASLHSKNLKHPEAKKFQSDYQNIEDLMLAGWKREAESNFFDLLRKSVFSGPSGSLSPDLKQLEFPMAYQRLIKTASKKFDLNEYLILSIMRAESGFRQDAESVVGARGLMQMMPRTAYKIAKLSSHKDFDVRELSDPIVNITYSSFYLNKLLQFYQKNLLLTVAAYNAGPKATNNWRKRYAHCEADELVESIPYTETRQYVKKVVRYFGQYLSIYENKQPPMDIIDTQEDGLPVDTNIF